MTIDRHRAGFTTMRKLGIVLKALDQGQEISLDGEHTYRMENERLYLKANRFKGRSLNGEVVWLETGEDFSINHLMRCVAKMSEDNIVMLASNNSLNDIMRGRAKRRGLADTEEP